MIVHEHFQCPLALEAGLAAIIIVVMALVFDIACRRYLLQTAVLVHAVVQMVPLPCAIDRPHIIQLGKYLAVLLVNQMAWQQAPEQRCAIAGRSLGTVPQVGRDLADLLPIKC